jgi:tRNA threonylcarbamoyladenosine biosynthesis protein TsaE
MATFISHSPAETEALGETWGRAAQPGLVIGLSGDLGAGKTQLVKGLARGLNITARVHSPTFSLVSIYEGGRLVLYHLDLYRLDTLEQITGAGLEEYLNTRGVTVVEWAEKWFVPPSVLGSRPGIVPNGAIAGRAYPDLFRCAEIATLGINERRIVYEGSGD